MGFLRRHYPDQVHRSLPQWPAQGRISAWFVQAPGKNAKVYTLVKEIIVHYGANFKFGSGRAGLGQEFQRPGVGYGLSAAAHAELAVDIVQMPLDSTDG